MGTTIQKKPVNQLNQLKLNGVVQPQNFSVAIAAGAANVLTLTVTAIDAKGNAVPAPVPFDLWVSDAATGIGLTASTPSGTLVATTGAKHTELTSKKEFKCITAATGIFVGSYTDTGKTATLYFAVKTPMGLVVVSVISGTNYG